MAGRTRAAVGFALLCGCGYTPGPEVKETRETMATTVAALNNYRKDCNHFPAKLQMLVDKPGPKDPELKKWKGPYLKDLPNDAWGKPLIYNQPGKLGLPYDLVSTGADMKWGGKKDHQDIAENDKSLGLPKK